MKNEINLLTISSDRYEPFWSLYYALLSKYSADLWHNKYHLTENKIVPSPGVITLNSHLPLKPASWSDNLLFALDNLEGEFVVILLEDFFFSQKINTENFQYCHNFISNNPDVGCMRLAPIPEGDQPYKDPFFKEHTSEQSYRISTQAAIWRISYLKKVVLSGENPWEFEINGSIRSNSLSEKILVTQREKTPFFYFNAVIQGKLTRGAYKFLKNEGLNVDLKEIKINGYVEEFYWKTRNRRLRSLIDFFNHRILPIKKI
jgi:hypothetical protein